MPCKLLVADSGPLIALTRLGLLQQLCARFDEACLPGKVCTEVTLDMARPDARDLAHALQVGRLKRVEVTAEEVRAFQRFGLDAGETEAIALAERLSSLLLKGRRAAQSLGLEIIGAAGLLIVFRREGMIPLLKPYLERLHDMGYFSSDTLVHQTLGLFDED